MCLLCLCHYFFCLCCLCCILSKWSCCWSCCLSLSVHLHISWQGQRSYHTRIETLMHITVTVCVTVKYRNRAADGPRISVTWSAFSLSLSIVFYTKATVDKKTEGKKQITNSSITKQRNKSPAIVSQLWYVPVNLTEGHLLAIFNHFHIPLKCSKHTATIYQSHSYNHVSLFNLQENAKTFQESYT